MAKQENIYCTKIESIVNKNIYKFAETFHYFGTRRFMLKACLCVNKPVIPKSRCNGPKSHNSSHMKDVH